MKKGLRRDVRVDAELQTGQTIFLDEKMIETIDECQPALHVDWLNETRVSPAKPSWVRKFLVMCWLLPKWTTIMAPQKYFAASAVSACWTWTKTRLTVFDRLDPSHATSRHLTNLSNHGAADRSQFGKRTFPDQGRSLSEWSVRLPTGQQPQSTNVF